MSVDTTMNISPVLGTNQDDNLVGTGRSEVLSGAGGDDRIQALSGDDEVFGGTGNDELYGQGGNDTMYGNGKPAYVDMSRLVIAQSTTAKVTFIDEGAGFRNSLGVYEIGPDGSISNVQILFPNSSKQGSGGDLIPGQSTVEFEIDSGSQVGFFVVPNGYGKGYVNREMLEDSDARFELRNADGEPGTMQDRSLQLVHIDAQSGVETPIISQYGTDLFHSATDADDGHRPNPDAFPHVVGRASTVTGELLIGFEDLYGGGDKDYDDNIIRLEIGQSNVVSLLPTSSGSGSLLPDDDEIYGGDGDDTLFGISGNDILYGGRGNDDLNGNSGEDILWGNEGNDLLHGNSGADILNGGAGFDELFGDSGDDTLDGGGDDDELHGGSGDDTLQGGSGSDKLNEGSDDDTLHGGSGNDTLNGNSGNDTLYGDSGADSLYGHSGNDIIDGGDGTDRVVGGGGDDVLYGGANNDRVYGGSGNDTLSGDAGDDYLTGGSGNDTLNGGSGNDKFIGGSGIDTFYFDMDEGGIGLDRIYDFQTGDVLAFEASGYADAQSLADSCLSVDGANLVFTLSDTETVTLKNLGIDTFSLDSLLLI